MATTKSLDDPATFAKEMLGVTLQPHQIEAMDAKAGTRTIIKGRQPGGTTTIIVRALHNAYRQANHLVLIVSASDRQSQEIGERMVEVVESAPIAKSLVRCTTERLTFSNGSEVYFLPNNPRTIRGFGVRGLVIRRKQKRPGATIFQDEACYAENGDQTRKACEYALATAPAEAREYWIISTPTTSDAWPMKYFELGQHGEPGFWSARWPSELNKYVDRAWLAQMRRTKLPAEVATEIDGQPSDDVQALFGPLLSRIVHPHPWPAPPQASRVCTVGVDLHLPFSRGSDYSVAALIGQGADPIHGESTIVLDMWRERTYMESDLLAVLDRWCAEHNVQKILVEQYASTGIVEGCLRRGLPVETVAPTPGNQSVAFTRLYTLAKEGRLVIPAGAHALIEELGSLRHSISETGVPRFSAPPGRSHDDTCFATAWAVHALGSVAPTELRFLGAGCPSRPAGMSRAEFLEAHEREDAIKTHAMRSAEQAEQDREWQEEQRERAEDFVYRVMRRGAIFPGD